MRLESRPISDTEWDVIGYTKEGDSEVLLGKIHKTIDGYYVYHIKRETLEEEKHERADNFEDAEKGLFRLIEKEFRDGYQ
ncbi:MAG: hypothetical protein OXC18_18490 [Desulfurellaceae bacterium]|nr:hypothetical protein [Desulfurellaceae bacterium]